MIKTYYVPVFSKDGKQLMPTKLSRAQRWIKSGKATPFWNKGVWCVRLNVQTLENLQLIVVGVDPGSKKEGMTVKATAHTYLNLQLDVPDWVKAAIESRRNARRSRRQRKCPYRPCRMNRKKKKGFLAPSTKSRWQWKLRVIKWLMKLFPITVAVVEDIKAETKGQRRWDKLFSSLQIGKKWFYEEIIDLGLELETRRGWETKNLRKSLGLKKNSDKLKEDFYTHCVDSWVLANDYVGGHKKPDNTLVMYLTPLHFHRRQLHLFTPSIGGKRKRYGSTMSLGLKRGTLVKHVKYGLCYVSGYSNKNRITLYNMLGKVVSEKIKIEDCKILSFSSWRFK